MTRPRPVSLKSLHIYGDPLRETLSQMLQATLSHTNGLVSVLLGHQIANNTSRHRKFTTFPRLSLLKSICMTNPVVARA